MERTACNQIPLTFVALLGLLLSACSAASDAQNQACKAMEQGGNLPWGYYPGYGCGPVPRARIDFSGLTVGELPAETA